MEKPKQLLEDCRREILELYAHPENVLFAPTASEQENPLYSAGAMLPVWLREIHPDKLEETIIEKSSSVVINAQASDTTAQKQKSKNNNNNNNSKKVQFGQRAEEEDIPLPEQRHLLAWRTNLARFCNSLMPHTSTRGKKEQEKKRKGGEQSEAQRLSAHPAHIHETATSIKKLSNQEEAARGKEGDGDDDDDEANKIRNRFDCLIEGVGGSGKTTVAQEICRLQPFKDAVAVYLPLHRVAYAKQEIVDLRDLLELCFGVVMTVVDEGGEKDSKNNKKKEKKSEDSSSSSSSSESDEEEYEQEQKRRQHGFGKDHLFTDSSANMLSGSAKRRRGLEVDYRYDHHTTTLVRKLVDRLCKSEEADVQIFDPIANSSNPNSSVFGAETASQASSPAFGEEGYDEAQGGGGLLAGLNNNDNESSSNNNSNNKKKKKKKKSKEAQEEEIPIVWIVDDLDAVDRGSERVGNFLFDFVSPRGRLSDAVTILNSLNSSPTRPLDSVLCFAREDRNRAACSFEAKWDCHPRRFVLERWDHDQTQLALYQQLIVKMSSQFHESNVNYSQLSELALAVCSEKKVFFGGNGPFRGSPYMVDIFAETVCLMALQQLQQQNPSSSSSSSSSQQPKVIDRKKLSFTCPSVSSLSQHLEQFASPIVLAERFFRLRFDRRGEQKSSSASANKNVSFDSAISEISTLADKMLTNLHTSREEMLLGFSLPEKEAGWAEVFVECGLLHKFKKQSHNRHHHHHHHNHDNNNNQQQKPETNDNNNESSKTKMVIFSFRCRTEMEIFAALKYSRNFDKTQSSLPWSATHRVVWLALASHAVFASSSTNNNKTNNQLTSATVMSAAASRFIASFNYYKSNVEGGESQLSRVEKLSEHQDRTYVYLIVELTKILDPAELIKTIASLHGWSFKFPVFFHWLLDPCGVFGVSKTFTAVLDKIETKHPVALEYFARAVRNLHVAPLAEKTIPDCVSAFRTGLTKFHPPNSQVTYDVLDPMTTRRCRTYVSFEAPSDMQKYFMEIEQNTSLLDEGHELLNPSSPTTITSSSSSSSPARKPNTTTPAATTTPSKTPQRTNSSSVTPPPPPLPSSAAQKQNSTTSSSNNTFPVSMPKALVRALSDLFSSETSARRQLEHVCMQTAEMQRLVGRFYFKNWVLESFASRDLWNVGEGKKSGGNDAWFSAFPPIRRIHEEESVNEALGLKEFGKVSAANYYKQAQAQRKLASSVAAGSSSANNKTLSSLDLADRLDNLENDCCRANHGAGDKMFVRNSETGRIRCRLALIEGPPHVGKTVFAQQLCVLQPFFGRVAIYVPLATMLHRHSNLLDNIDYFIATMQFILKSLPFKFDFHVPVVWIMDDIDMIPRSYDRKLAEMLSHFSDQAGSSSVMTARNFTPTNNSGNFGPGGPGGGGGGGGNITPSSPSLSFSVSHSKYSAGSTPRTTAASSSSTSSGAKSPSSASSSSSSPSFSHRPHDLAIVVSREIRENAGCFLLNEAKPFAMERWYLPPWTPLLKRDFSFEMWRRLCSREKYSFPDYFSIVQKITSLPSMLVQGCRPKLLSMICRLVATGKFSDKTPDSVFASTTPLVVFAMDLAERAANRVPLDVFEVLIANIAPIATRSVASGFPFRLSAVEALPESGFSSLEGTPRESTAGGGGGGGGDETSSTTLGFSASFASSNTMVAPPGHHHHHLHSSATAVINSASAAAASAASGGDNKSVKSVQSMQELRTRDNSLLDFQTGNNNNNNNQNNNPETDNNMKSLDAEMECPDWLAHLVVLGLVRSDVVKTASVSSSQQKKISSHFGTPFLYTNRAGTSTSASTPAPAPLPTPSNNSTRTSGAVGGNNNNNNNIHSRSNTSNSTRNSSSAIMRIASTPSSHSHQDPVPGSFQAQQEEISQRNNQRDHHYIHTLSMHERNHGIHYLNKEASKNIEVVFSRRHDVEYLSAMGLLELSSAFAALRERENVEHQEKQQRSAAAAASARNQHQQRQEQLRQQALHNIKQRQQEQKQSASQKLQPASSSQSLNYGSVTPSASSSNVGGGEKSISPSPVPPRNYDQAGNENEEEEEEEYLSPLSRHSPPSWGIALRQSWMIAADSASNKSDIIYLASRSIATALSSRNRIVATFAAILVLEVARSLPALVKELKSLPAYFVDSAAILCGLFGSPEALIHLLSSSSSSSSNSSSSFSTSSSAATFSVSFVALIRCFVTVALQADCTPRTMKVLEILDQYTLGATRIDFVSCSKLGAVPVAEFLQIIYIRMKEQKKKLKEQQQQKLIQQGQKPKQNEVEEEEERDSPKNAVQHLKQQCTSLSRKSKTQKQNNKKNHKQDGDDYIDLDMLYSLDQQEYFTTLSQLGWVNSSESSSASSSSPPSSPISTMMMAPIKNSATAAASSSSSSGFSSPSSSPSNPASVGGIVRRRTFNHNN